MSRRWIRALHALGVFACVLPESAFGEEPVGYLLDLPPGARAIGMGMAHGAVAEGPDSGYWNPAALAFVEPGHAAVFTYSRLPAFERKLPFLFGAYSASIPQLRGAVGVSFAYFDFREFAGTRPYEMAPAVSYGGRLTDALAVGIGFKIYHFDYTRDPPDYDNTATTALFDGGVLWRGVDSRVFLGGSIQNLGPGLELGGTAGSTGTSFPPSRNLKLAFGARPVNLENTRLLVACDLNIPLAGEDNSPRLAVGGEMLAGKYAAMRIGLRYDGWALRDESYEEDPQKYATTIGFGVRVRDLTFDYANAPWDVLSVRDAHHFTVGTRF